MDIVNSYDELEEQINGQISDVNHFHLVLSDLFINFDLQLEWIDSILREHETEEFSQLSEEDQNISFENRISINFTNCKFKKLDCSNRPESNILEVNITGGSMECQHYFVPRLFSILSISSSLICSN